MATLPATELIVTIDDQSMVNKIKQALKLMKGVCGVKVKRQKMTSLDKAIEDVKHGRVTYYNSVEELKQDIMF